MNVRWDAVVISHPESASAALAAVQSSPQLVARQCPDCIQVQVHLFGVLSSLSVNRLIELSLPLSATIADVLAVLRQRLGEGFLPQVLDRAGKKHRHCRLFVDGYVVEDVNTRLAAKAEPTQIEIILLIAPEGG
jgi:hypothetical protein